MQATLTRPKWAYFDDNETYEKSLDHKWCIFNGHHYVHPQSSAEEAMRLAEKWHGGHIAYMEYSDTAEIAVPMVIREVNAL